MAKFSRYERHLLRTYSKKYHIPAHILAGQIEVESGNQPGQVSSAGAFGRTQFIPSTARSYGVKRGDTRKAVKSQYRGQAKYLADLGGGKDRAHLIAALGGYYGQQGTDYPGKVLGAAAKYYKHLGGGKGGGGRKGRTVGGNLQGKLKITPGRSFAPERQQARLTTLSQAHGGMPSQNQLLSLAGQLSDLQDQPGTQTLKLSRSKVRRVKGKGGSGGAAYPLHGASQGRIDMGVDFTHHGPVKAMADGVVVAAAAGGTGWPGGGWVSYKLTSGPHKGRVVFVAENVSPRVKKGQRVRAGQTVAHAHGGLETGWASGKGFGTLSAARGTQNKQGDPGARPTPEGKSFNRYLRGVRRKRR